jgi:hypothetical protein
VFRWRFKKVPPGTDPASGRRVLYTSMEERCNACRVYGGAQHECVDLAPYVAVGKLCPRALLDPDNVIPFGIVSRSGVEPPGLFDVWLPLHLDSLGLKAGQKLLMIERAISTQSHPIVVEYQDRERERARLAAKGGRRE